MPTLFTACEWTPLHCHFLPESKAGGGAGATWIRPPGCHAKEEGGDGGRWCCSVSGRAHAHAREVSGEQGPSPQPQGTQRTCLFYHPEYKCLMICHHKTFFVCWNVDVNNEVKPGYLSLSLGTEFKMHSSFILDTSQL